MGLVLVWGFPNSLIWSGELDPTAVAVS
jgi:hypothetical protein